MPIVKKLKASEKKIVLGHGVFDFLHYGHIFYLQQAKAIGDILVVSVMADKFVIKENDRPVFGEATRAKFIASLECVDYVIICREDGPYEIIKKIEPHIYSKGEDSKPQLKNSKSGFSKDKKILKSVGGILCFTKSLPIHSSDILNEFIKVNRRLKKTVSKVDF